jgi:hypothetical protein
MGLIKTTKYVAPLSIEDQVEIAIKALPAWRYKIGFLNRDHDDPKKQMILRDGDEKWVSNNIQTFKHNNADGREILFYPLDPRYILLDDLTSEAVKRLESEGFAPALVVETSPGNMQAWIKFPDLRGIKAVEQEYCLALSRQLIAKFGGDPGAAGGLRFGKLPGFRNRKSKHITPDGRAPMVVIRSASGHEAPGGKALAERVRSELMAAQAVHQVAESREKPISAVETPQVAGEVGGAGMAIQAQYEIALQRAGGDRSRADFALAARLAEAGLGEDQIAMLIEEVSEKAAERGSEYARRTAAAAIARTAVRPR